MATFIIILAVLALVHFIYDGILLPSFRFKARNELFAVRDEIRNHYIEKGGKVNNKAFNVVHDGITRTLNKLHLLTPSMFAAAEEEYRSNKAFRESVDSRTEVIDNCGDQLLIDGRANANHILDRAFLSNIGMWMLYLMPIAMIVSAIHGLKQLITNRLSKFANEMISATSSAFVRLEKEQMHFA